MEFAPIFLELMPNDLYSTRGVAFRLDLSMNHPLMKSKHSRSCQQARSEIMRIPAPLHMAGKTDTVCLGHHINVGRHSMGASCCRRFGTHQGCHGLRCTMLHSFWHDANLALPRGARVLIMP